MSEVLPDNCRNDRNRAMDEYAGNSTRCSFGEVGSDHNLLSFSAFS